MWPRGLRFLFPIVRLNIVYAKPYGFATEPLLSKLIRLINGLPEKLSGNYRRPLRSSGISVEAKKRSGASNSVALGRIPLQI